MRCSALPMMRFARSSWRAKPRCRSTRARPPATSCSATQWVAVRLPSSSGSLISLMLLACGCIPLPDWQRVRFTALRLQGPNSARSNVARRPRRWHHSLSGSAGLVSPTRGGHINCRTTASTRSTPTPHSGFDDDERDYSIAARMLRMLYRTRIAAHQQSGQALRSHKGRH
jgi:hypothetical protein